MNKSKNTCTIYDKYFIDDLLDYSLDQVSSDSLVIKYSDDKTASIDFSKATNCLQDLIKKTVSLNKKELVGNCWYPLLIDTQTNKTQNNMLFKGSMSTIDTLGIEDAINFEPVFKNWTINGNAKMSTDWIINSHYTPYIVQYGVLCWYKESESDFTPSPNFYQIPPHCVLVPKTSLSYTVTENKKTRTISVSPRDKVIKLDNNTLRIVGRSGQEFDSTSGEFVFKQRDEFFSITDFLLSNYPRNRTETDIAYENRINRVISTILLFDIYGATNSPINPSFLGKSKKDKSLYIADGEAYSYFDSDIDKEESLLSKEPSKSFVSPTQYAIYREIFNILTIDSIKSLDTARPSHEHKNIHKLACFLSTHPDIDRTTVNILTQEKIQQHIKEKYIANKPVSVEKEISTLFETISFISEYFKDLSTDIKQTKESTNIIRTPEHLFRKLVSKYSSSLSISSDVTIGYKNKLKYGPHVRVDQDIISTASRSISNTIVYNNFTANIGSYVLSSNINQNQTSFNLKNTLAGNEQTVIPLWDIAKKYLQGASSTLSAGNDIVITMKDSDIGKEIVYNLGDDNTVQIPIPLLDSEESDVLWTKISGPDCIRFSDKTLSTIRGEGGFSGATAPAVVATDRISGGITNPVGASTSNATPPIVDIGSLRFLSSTDEVPLLYIKSRGKYVLQVRSKSSMGVFYDTKVIYVVDSKGNYDTNKKVEQLNLGRSVTIGPKNGLVVLCPNLRSFAVGKQFIFMPKSSDLTIKVRGSFVFGKNFSFGSEPFKFMIPRHADEDNTGNSSPASVSFSYAPNNTKILVKKLSLQYMMDNNNDCNKCESFYKNVLDNKGFIVDANNEFVLVQDPSPGVMGQEYKFSWPDQLSTDRSRIYSYGGFDSDVISKLDIEIPFHYRPGTLLPPITGADMTGPRVSSTNNNALHLCYPRPVEEFTTGTTFYKGCFHPSSGWIVMSANSSDESSKELIEYLSPKPQFLNKTSVINFDASRRKTFVFKGAGFFDLNNTATTGSTVPPQLYFSNILVNVDPRARACLKFPDGCSEEDIIATERKEIDDHNPNYGYRDSSGQFNKIRIINSDEFDTSIRLDPAGGVASNEYCTSVASQQYEVSYSFTKRGPYVDDAARSPKNRYLSSIASAKIEDIEVEINFMNYVDTKNMVIWLDVIPCEAAIHQLSQNNTDKWRFVTNRVSNSIFTNSYNTTKSQLESMPPGALKDYMLSLFNMNNNPKWSQVSTGQQSLLGFGTRNAVSEEEQSPVIRLYLLNQEHIEGNRYNFSLKFSDNANKYTASHNTNYNEYIDPQQIKAVEKDGVIHLLPTVAASGYNDKDIQFFRKIIQTNNLDTINNKFMKFNGLPLFRSGPPQSLDSWGSTIFSLGIAIMNPSTEMTVYDSVDSTDTVSAIDKTLIENRSNILINNICSWNLILHIDTNGYSCNGFRPDDTFGNLTYNNNMEPYIPGYSFIANLKDKKFLLPPININAPYSPFVNSQLCKYSLERLSAPAFSYTPLFILPLIIITTAGTLVDAVALASSVDFQGAEISRGIVQYLSKLRRAAQSAEYFKSLYIPVYKKYPMGEADKVLISVSKDGGSIWYKLEASIFKYDNCPIIKRKKYTYLKLNYRTARSLSIFNFSKINKLEQLLDIDIDHIKIISINVNDINDIYAMNSSSLENTKKSLEIEKKRLLESLKSITNEDAITRIRRRITDLEQSIAAYDATITSIGFRIKKYDIVVVLGTDTFNSKTKGIYFVHSDPLDTNKIRPEKIDVPGKLKAHLLLHKLRKDNLLSFLDIDLVEVDEPAPTPQQPGRKIKVLKIRNNIIVVDGIRPFYFFDKADQVTIIRKLEDYITELRNTGNKADKEAAEELEKNIQRIEQRLAAAIAQNKTELIKTIEQELWDAKHILNTNSIVNKGYVKTSNGYKTIFELADDVPGNEISVSPTQSSNGLIYDGDFITIHDKTNITPYNKWSLSDTNNSVIRDDSAPEIQISTFGEHSYGTGSLLIDPPILTKKDIQNNIKPLHEYIGTEYTPCKRPITVYISGDINNSIVTNLIGYNYTPIDIEYEKNKLNAFEINSFGLPIDLKRFFNKSHTFTDYHNNMALMDVKSEIFRQDGGLNNDYGYIEFDLGMVASTPSYAFSATEASTIENRLNFLLLNNKLTLSLSRCETEPCRRDLIRSANPDDLSFEDTKTYISNASYLVGRAGQTNLEKAKTRLPQLQNEIQTILMYCDMGKITVETVVLQNQKRIVCTAYSGEKILPFNKITVEAKNNKALEFTESFNDNYYWINIDPEQSCSIDISEVPKILVSTEITCLKVDDQITFGARNICPRTATNIDGEDIDINFKSAGNIVYQVSQSAYDLEVSLYTGQNSKLSWIPYNEALVSPAKLTYIVERFFFLNMLGQERNQLVKSVEKYCLPNNVYNKSPDDTLPDGDVTNKVKNIFNLNNTNELKVKFKRIPRKIKGIDNDFELYKPNVIGQLTKSVMPPEGGPIDTTPKYWHCFDSQYGNLIEPPIYYKWLNEMIFRGHYGSIDGAEFRGATEAESKEMTNWVPYDYYD